MLKNLFSKVVNYAIKHPPEFLLWSTIVGYGISSLGEAGGIYFNKKIKKEERTFMAIQDLLEGALKLGMFFTLAVGLKNFGRKLVTDGKIFSNSANKELLAEGMATIGLLTGNVLSFNLLTPIIRNPIAAWMQKNIFKKKLPDLEPHRIAATPLSEEKPGILGGVSPFTQFERRMQIGQITKPAAMTFTSRGGLRI